jgi:hypothetical protein
MHRLIWASLSALVLATPVAALAQFPSGGIVGSPIPSPIPPAVRAAEDFEQAKGQLERGRQAAEVIHSSSPLAPQVGVPSGLARSGPALRRSLAAELTHYGRPVDWWRYSAGELSHLLRADQERMQQYATDWGLPWPPAGRR